MYWCPGILMRTRYEIPSGFTDEVRFFRIFPLRSFLILLLTAVPGFGLFKLLSPFGIGLYVFFFWIMVEGIVVGATIIPIPVERWKDGGGVTYEIFLLRKFLRRHKKSLFIKGYNQLQYEEELNHELYD